MAAKNKRTGSEWVCGLVTMPGRVTGEAEGYRPEMLYWMNGDGALLGHSIGRPGELLGVACESLRNTVAAPLIGRPHAPARVRVASPELAEVLRAGQSDVEIVCAPTPEIDAFVAALGEHVNEAGEIQQSYLSSEVEPDEVAAWFRAAAGLFRAKPWEVVPVAQNIIAVSIEALEVNGAVLSTLGQMKDQLGFVVFWSLEDFDTYADTAEAFERGEVSTMPPHIALSFAREAALSPALRKEIAKHDWEIAGPDGYPWLSSIDEHHGARPASAKEVAIAEAIALALPQVLEEREALRTAWSGGAAVVRTVRVATHGGDVEVVLGAPYEVSSLEQLSSRDLCAELVELAMDEQVESEMREPIEAELLRRLAGSPEAAALADVSSCRIVMDVAAEYFDTAIVALRPDDLRAILFNIIPRQVSIAASEARAIIEQNRAFFAFLKREVGIEHADGCLRLLGDKAVEKLEAALSDTSNFGMAKLLVMRGNDAGFDMSSPEGVDAWMRIAQSQPVPARPVPRPHDRAAARAKKAARKTAKKARKKSR